MSITENQKLEYRIQYLEKQVRELIDQIKFYSLDSIPKKYRKAFYEPGENPFYKIKKQKPAYPPVQNMFGSGSFEKTLVELDMPTDPEEYKKAWERVKERAKNGWPNEEQLKSYHERYFAGGRTGIKQVTSEACQSSLPTQE